jgi:ribonuclease D
MLGRLKAIARWRELEAQGKDLPRGRIVKDETLGDLAGNPPRKQADLAKVRGLSASWAGNDIGGRLMAAIEGATPLSADELPPRDDRKPGLGKEGSLVADLLKLLLKIRSRDIDVASKLLARGDELEALAAGTRKGLPMLEGWRYDQFGRDALDLVEGRLAFAVKNGRLTMTRTEEEA